MPWTRRRDEAGGKFVRACLSALVNRVSTEDRPPAVASAPCSVWFTAEPVRQACAGLLLDLGVDVGSHGQH